MRYHKAKRLIPESCFSEEGVSARLKPRFVAPEAEV
jgi:hypothetical protein